MIPLDKIMKKKRIFILEGADNLGKSYQARYLEKSYKFHILNQPNADNTLGYLRNDLKYDESIDITVRQLFHAFQNSVDIFEFPQHTNIIMDRCYLSNIVYSTVMGVDTHVIEMMIKMNKTIWEKYLSEYEINLICFTSNAPFKEADDADVYESANVWDKLSEEYITHLVQNKNNNSIFPRNVKCSIMDISLMSKEEVSSALQREIYKVPLLLNENEI